MNAKLVVLILLVAGAAGGGWYYLNNQAEPDPVAQEVLEEYPALPQRKKVIKETLAVEHEPDYQAQRDSAVEPPEKIDGSDDTVREAVADVSAPLASWLSPQHQLRKWVSVVDQVATYKLPNKNLPLVYPKDEFEIEKTAAGTFSAPSNKKRWDLLVGTITSLDPKRAAVYYKAWSPMLEASYAELGSPLSFDSQVRTSIEHLLIVEPLPAAARLHQPKVYYEYVDPALENADPLSKWLWRLGPENMAALQTWLRELLNYL